MCEDAGNVDGTFGVRKREAGSDDLALTVVFRSRATHHLIERDADGVFTINKQKYGDHTTVVSVGCAPAALLPRLPNPPPLPAAASWLRSLPSLKAPRGGRWR